jgi:uncharacterized membrane protein
VTARSRSAASKALIAASGTATLVVASLVGAMLAYGQKLACSSGGNWNAAIGQFRSDCYTDIYPLYYSEGLSSGKVPYIGHPVEYPVLIGAIMEAGSWLVRNVADPYARGQDFYYVTIAMLALCLLAGVLATAYTLGPQRRWAALLVALAPGMITGAFINWDLLAMALTACGMAAWAARRNMLSGVLLALAVSAKFYPLVVIFALFLLCLRAGKLREFSRMAAVGVATWMVVNVPVWIAAPAGWARFYAYSRSRGADWGSIWYLFQVYKVPVLGDAGILNDLSTAAFLVAAAAIVMLTLTAPRRPRVPQVAYLLLAAFLICNKVWSPQYVVWLLPLAVLARPRVWPYLLWQFAEVIYFFGIWGYLVYLYGAPGGLPTGWYFIALGVRLGAVALLAYFVVADILQPSRDVARLQGTDDPAGGILNGAPDRLRIHLRLRLRRATSARAPVHARS